MLNLPQIIPTLPKILVQGDFEISSHVCQYITSFWSNKQIADEKRCGPFEIVSNVTEQYNYVFYFLKQMPDQMILDEMIDWSQKTRSMVQCIIMNNTLKIKDLKITESYRIYQLKTDEESISLLLQDIIKQIMLDQREQNDIHIDFDESTPLESLQTNVYRLQYLACTSMMTISFPLHLEILKIQQKFKISYFASLMTLHFDEIKNLFENEFLKKQFLEAKKQFLDLIHQIFIQMITVLGKVYSLECLTRFISVIKIYGEILLPTTQKYIKEQSTNSKPSAFTEILEKSATHHSSDHQSDKDFSKSSEQSSNQLDKSQLTVKNVTKYNKMKMTLNELITRAAQTIIQIDQKPDYSLFAIDEYKQTHDDADAITFLSQLALQPEHLMMKPSYELIGLIILFQLHFQSFALLNDSQTQQTDQILFQYPVALTFLSKFQVPDGVDALLEETLPIDFAQSLIEYSTSKSQPTVIQDMLEIDSEQLILNLQKVYHNVQKMKDFPKIDHMIDHLLLKAHQISSLSLDFSMQNNKKQTVEMYIFGPSILDILKQKNWQSQIPDYQQCQYMLIQSNFLSCVAVSRILSTYAKLFINDAGSEAKYLYYQYQLLLFRLRYTYNNSFQQLLESQFVNLVNQFLNTDFAQKNDIDLINSISSVYEECKQRKVDPRMFAFIYLMLLKIFVQRKQYLQYDSKNSLIQNCLLLSRGAEIESNSLFLFETIEECKLQQKFEPQKFQFLFSKSNNQHFVTQLQQVNIQLSISMPSQHSESTLVISQKYMFNSFDEMKFDLDLKKETDYTVEIKSFEIIEKINDIFLLKRDLIPILNKMKTKITTKQRNCLNCTPLLKFKYETEMVKFQITKNEFWTGIKNKFMLLPSQVNNQITYSIQFESNDIDQIQTTIDGSITKNASFSDQISIELTTGLETDVTMIISTNQKIVDRFILKCKLPFELYQDAIIQPNDEIVVQTQIIPKIKFSCTFQQHQIYDYLDVKLLNNHKNEINRKFTILQLVKLIPAQVDCIKSGLDGIHFKIHQLEKHKTQFIYGYNPNLIMTINYEDNDAQYFIGWTQPVFPTMMINFNQKINRLNKIQMEATSTVYAAFEHNQIKSGELCTVKLWVCSFLAQNVNIHIKPINQNVQIVNLTAFEVFMVPYEPQCFEILLCCQQCGKVDLIEGKANDFSTAIMFKQVE